MMARIIYFIRRRWKLFILLFTLLFIPLCYAINQREVLYRAEAKIAFIGEGGGFSIDLEARKMKEIDFLRKISEEIPRLDISTLNDNLDLKFEKDNVLLVSFISTDPVLARDALNTATSLFLEERDESIESISSERRSRLKVLSDQIATLKYNLSASQKRLRELRQKNAELDKRRVDLESWLAGLELQEAELLKIFTEKHPEVINIAYRIESVQSQLDSLPDNTPVYNELAAEVEGWNLTLSSKEKEYEELADLFKSKGEAWHAELAERAALPIKPLGKPRAWYYAWGLTAVFLASLLFSLIIEIIDRKIYTREEAQLQLGLPVIAEIDKVIFEKRGRFRGLGSGEKVLFNYQSNSQSLIKYEQLYTFLKLDVFKGSMDRKAVLITSAEAETGKTFIACNLALAAAKNGEKVLLIDANFRYPSVHHFFGFADDTNGISDVLRGSLNHKDVVKNLSDLLLTGSLRLDEEEVRGFDNLRILLSGTRVETPLRLLEARELSGLFKQLCQNYGLLIIDTPPLRGYADTFNLVSSVDALLLVARKGKTTYPLLKDVIFRIRKMEGPLTGLVFSHV